MLPVLLPFCAARAVGTRTATASRAAVVRQRVPTFMEDLLGRGTELTSVGALGRVAQERAEGAVEGRGGRRRAGAADLALRRRRLGPPEPRVSAGRSGKGPARRIACLVHAQVRTF